MKINPVNLIAPSLTVVTVALVVILAGGCGKSSNQLRVGVLNTARIVQEDPAFKDMKLDIMKEKSSYLSALPDNPEHLTKDQWDKLREDSQKKQAEWENKVMTFINGSVKQITNVTAEVAKQRDLDMVVINTPYTQAVHYTTGQDVTLDVLLKMSTK